MNLKRICSFITALSLIFTIFSATYPEKAEAAVWFQDNFETDEKLGMWQSIGGGSVEISDERQKIDKKSLKWTYEKGNKLRITGVDSFGGFQSFKRGEGFKLWIYSTNRTDDDIMIKIGKASKIDESPSYLVKFNMDFEGWRCVWARVNEFARTGNSNDGADSLQIELPASMGNGVMYLDSFEVVDYVPYTACADKHLKEPPITYTGYQYLAYTKIPGTIDEKQCLPEYKKAFRIIEERLNEYILPEGINYDALDDNDPVKIRYKAFQNGIKNNIKTYDNYKIRRREDGSMEGPGITATLDTVGLVGAGKFEKIWVALAADWRLNKNEDSKNKFMDLCDFCYEQGWAEGSSMGAMRFDEIRLCGYIFGIYMMRDELRETGRLERELANLKWRSEFGCIFGFDDPEISEFSAVDVDKMRSVVFYQLIYILSMEDIPEKAAYMKAYSDYVSKIIMPVEGVGGGIKKDGTIWHHSNAFMAAYGSEAINVLCQIKYMLDDTYFDLTEEATKVLEKSLRVYRESSNTIQVPLRIRGRYPGVNETMIRIAPAYAFMAATGNREAAEIFLDVWDWNSPDVQSSIKTCMPSITWFTTLGQFPMFQKLEKEAVAKGYTAAKPTEGSFVYPYGGYAVYRKDNWMAAISGFSKYIWDYEGSTTENFYGRYMNYGSTTIVSRDGFVADGIDVDNGWDWNRWPGVTSKHLTNQELEVRGVSRHYSDEGFLGGIGTDTQKGVYAMKLHDNFYDTSFRANKSWFYFGDKLICLGSDITNADNMHNTETTLFQNVMKDKAIAINVNDDEITEFPYENSFDGTNVCLVDIDSNGYVIPDAKGLKIERKTNESNLQGSIRSVGDQSVAYLDHGKAPKSGEYEYMILPQKGVEATLLAAQNPGYKVIRKDSSVHAVMDEESGAIGYVFFKTDKELASGIVKSVTRPCVVMEEVKDEALTLSFCDPDLRIVTAGTVKQQTVKSEPLTTKVVIEGAWEMKEKNPDARVISRGKDTVIEFDGADGKQTDVEMVRIK